MAGIDVSDFRGLNETRDQRLLDNGEGRVAEEINFDGSGGLRCFDACWRDILDPNVLYNPKTIYLYDNGTTKTWFTWAGQVDIARAPVFGDTLYRLYVSNDGANANKPQMTHKDLPLGTFVDLGIPAPTTAPTASATLPETALAGTITSITCATLKMIHEVKGSEGRNSGNGETNVVATTTPVRLTTFPVGTRVKVVSIVDANNVTVTGVGDASFSATVDKLNYGLKWTNVGGDSLWRKRKKAYWNFLIPSGVTVGITSHGLSIGDIIQVTATASPMSWEFATVSTSPNTDQSSRTATKLVPGNIVFTGDCNFIIDRGGATIDPLVPSQNFVVETRAYVVTHVTEIGEESAPSPASDIVTVAVGDPVSLSAFPAHLAGTTHRRIYRTNTGSDGSEFQFVAEIPILTATYSDTLDPSELAEVLPSESWLPPPIGLSNIIALPNGSLCGFLDKALCFSEPGYPHAWPPEYRYPIDNRIVSIAAFGSSVAVGTDGTPYVFSGSHPRQMSPRRIRVNEPCLGRNSAINIGDRVVYVSPNGVISISEDGVVNLTKDKIPLEVWREKLKLALQPEGPNDPPVFNFNVRGYFYDGRLEYVLTYYGVVTGDLLGEGTVTVDDVDLEYRTYFVPLVTAAFNLDRVDFSYGALAEFVSHYEPSEAGLYRLVLE
jgi:hypothetical protein